MSSFAFNQGLIHLDKKYPGLFHLNTANYQFTPGLGYQPHVRHRQFNHHNRLETAVEAIDVIVAKQG